MRWLVSPSPHGQGHRLGLIWLQEPGGHHLIDGDHLAYLHPSHDAGEELRLLDPDPYDRLRLMAARSGARHVCYRSPDNTNASRKKSLSFSRFSGVSKAFSWPS
jgi:hypothetical protein